jgi:heat shock protein HslJ
MRRRIHLSLLALAALALVACGGDRDITPTGSSGNDATASPDATPAGAELAGTSWLLATLDGRAPVAGTNVSIVFHANRATGVASCNSWFGTYQLGAADALTFSDIGNTEMYCDPPAIMDQETAFLDALQGVTSFELDTDTLTLRSDSGGPTMTFEREASIDNGEVPTSWTLVTFVSGDTASSLLTDTTITLDFASDSLATPEASFAVAGSSGCNRYTANVERQGDRVTVSPPTSTRMFCGSPEGVMDQESRYLSALEATTMIAVESHELQFATDDERMLIFRPAEE